MTIGFIAFQGVRQSHSSSRCLHKGFMSPLPQSIADPDSSERRAVSNYHRQTSNVMQAVYSGLRYDGSEGVGSRARRNFGEQE
jgi:hypothetical protein